MLKLGQIKKINNIEFQVKYINQNFAWLAPIKDNFDKGIIKGFASIKLPLKLK